MKNTLKILGIIALAAVIGFTFAACEPPAEDITYAVTFNTYGGSEVAAQDVLEGGKVTEPEDPTKANNTFAGWYKEGTFTTPWDFDTDTVTKDTTLHAKWTVNIESYTVTFNSNGGNPATSTQTVAKDGKATAPVNVTKAPVNSVNQVLEGWYKDNETFKEKWDFSTDTVTVNVTLYAKWVDGDPATFTITFESNDGSVVAQATVKGDQKITKPADPTKDGYTFAGWYKEVGLTTPWDFDTGIVTENITLYAKWTVVEIPPLDPSYYGITESGATFSATKGTETVGAGTIQDVITAIRTHSAGEAVTIHFGNGVSTLDIGTASASFNTTNGTWGEITLMGKITSANNTTTQGTIATAGTVSITSKADIANTVAGTNGRAVYVGGGTLTISEGTISSTGSALYGYIGTLNVSGGTITSTTTSISNAAIYKSGSNNSNNITINITGGKISVEGSGSRCIYDNSMYGSLNITGGEISSTTGTTIYANGGKITIGGDAKVSATYGNAISQATQNYTTTITGNATVTSGNDSLTQGGTIYISISSVYSGTTSVVDIMGGTVSNTAANGYAIYNSSNTYRFQLGGDPTIIGKIHTKTTAPTDGSLPVGNIILSTATGTAFAPGTSKKYTLDYPVFSLGMNAVPGGKNFLSNFELSSSEWKLLASGDNLLVATPAMTGIIMVTFISNGGSIVPAQAVGSGEKITTPPATTRAGYTLDGWYKEDSLTTKWEFAMDSFVEQTTLYAKWAPTATLSSDYYSIYKNGTVFTAVKGSTEIGYGNMAAVLTAIRTDAAAANCTIYFGIGGDDVLDVGAPVSQHIVNFNATGSGAAWGTITLKGKITGYMSNSSYGIIGITGNTAVINIDIEADIANTAGSGGNRTFYNGAIGTINVKSGTIGHIHNDRTGTINVTGGTISSISNNGTLNISGGTIASNYLTAVQNDGIANISGTANISYTGNSNSAILNGQAGITTISGGTITSNITSLTAGATVYTNGSNDGKLIITGGTFSNTSTGFVILAAQSASLSPTITLGGSPTIEGRIRPSPTGSLIVASAESDVETFAPGANKYTLDYASPTTGTVAVIGGAPFASNFETTSTTVALQAIGDDLKFQ